MSMTCLIRAVLAADDNYDKMYAVYEACNKAGISYPQEVRDYFGSAIDDCTVKKAGAIKYIKVEPQFDEESYEQVYTVELDKLPKSTKAIQMGLSW